MNREHNTLSFGERFKIANENGTLQRGADLMALAHFCLTTASMLLGETEALLDAYGLFRMDIKQSFNALMNAFDRYYAIYMRKGNFTREEKLRHRCPRGPVLPNAVRVRRPAAEVEGGRTAQTGGAAMRRKTTIVPLFSNGTEFTLWMERNCARCYKAPHLPRHDGNDYYDNGATFTKCYCAVHRDIDRQVIGKMEISRRSADIVANYSCPIARTLAEIRTQRPTADAAIRGGRRGIVNNIKS